MLVAKGGSDDVPGLVHRRQNEIGVRADECRARSLSAAGCGAARRKVA